MPRPMEVSCYMCIWKSESAIVLAIAAKQYVHTYSCMCRHSEVLCYSAIEIHNGLMCVPRTATLRYMYIVLGKLVTAQGSKELFLCVYVHAVFVV